MSGVSAREWAWVAVIAVGVIAALVYLFWDW